MVLLQVLSWQAHHLQCHSGYLLDGDVHTAALEVRNVLAVSHITDLHTPA